MCVILLHHVTGNVMDVMEWDLEFSPEIFDFWSKEI